MRAMGVRGVLVYCSDYLCSHSVAIAGRITLGYPTWSRVLDDKEEAAKLRRPYFVRVLSHLATLSASRDSMAECIMARLSGSMR
jgi:hypothetical protein